MQPLTTSQKEEIKAMILPLLDDLHRVALSLCHNQNNAEELVAETVAKACESFDSLRDMQKAKAWLLRILSNTFVSQYRTKMRHQEVEYNDEPSDDDYFSLFAQVSQPFLLWWGNPERELVAKLMDEDIRRALESLPADFRIAVVLCDVEGYSYEEIAEILKIPIGTVRSRIARGRSLLQKKLWHHALDMGLIQQGTHHDEQRNRIHQEH